MPSRAAIPRILCPPSHVSFGEGAQARLELFSTPTTTKSKVSKVRGEVRL